MRVLISAVEVTRILDVHPNTVIYLRQTGKLKPVRRKPYQFALDQVERLRIERAKRPVRLGRPRASVTIQESAR